MSAPRSTRRLGRVALACAVAGSLVALVAWSSVDADLVLALVAFVLLGVAVILGLVHVIISATRRIVPTLTIVGAVVVVITGILVSAGIPFTARWSASESAFTTYGAGLPSTVGDGSTGVFPGECPTRLGLFRIDGCYQAYSTYFLYDRTARSSAGRDSRCGHGALIWSSRTGSSITPSSTSVGTGTPSTSRTTERPTDQRLDRSTARRPDGRSGPRCCCRPHRSLRG